MRQWTSDFNHDETLMDFARKESPCLPFHFFFNLPISPFGADNWWTFNSIKSEHTDSFRDEQYFPQAGLWMINVSEYVHVCVCVSMEYKKVKIKLLLQKVTGDLWTAFGGSSALWTQNISRAGSQVIKQTQNNAFVIVIFHCTLFSVSSFIVNFQLTVIASKLWYV